jgi:hypothetical protein
MKKIIFILVLLLNIQFTGNSDCIPKMSIEKEWKETDAIFVGKVINNVSNSSIYDNYGHQLNYSTIKIIKIFKNDYTTIISDTVTFFEHGIDSYRFKEGFEYLIFAKCSGSFWNTNICSRTCLLKDSYEIIPILEKKAETFKTKDEEVEIK